MSQEYTKKQIFEIQKNLTGYELNYIYKLLQDTQSVYIEIKLDEFIKKEESEYTTCEVRLERKGVNSIKLSVNGKKPENKIVPDKLTNTSEDFSFWNLYLAKRKRFLFFITYNSFFLALIAITLLIHFFSIEIAAMNSYVITMSIAMLFILYPIILKFALLIFCKYSIRNILEIFAKFNEVKKS